ncbi:hypothetical protein [uncultured Draconibacterium sp.]|uniref:hypothetical protein n=1 Tax=uncultured Draconibacterium sp. TaxID=1573823 RepID=UPI002AA92F6C|nr:hypothetical protein [uncultured Draconibacterium sp.]
MSFTTKYRPLFEVNILHKYFLNKGNDDYFSMTDAEKEKQLAGYPLSELFSIVPSATTLLKLNGYKLICKITDHGFMVWSQISESNNNMPLVTLNDSLSLTFLLKTTKSTFNHFTQVGLSNAGQFFFFSNNRLSTEAPGFPLIKKANNTTAITDSYRLSAGSINNKKRLMSTEELENLVGIIRIGMKGENGSYHITKADGSLRNEHREFNIVFANRKTTWRYFFDADQQTTNNDDVKKENGNPRQLITKTEQPLTTKGFVSIKLGELELPNPDVKQINANSTLTKIYSEIFM